MTVLVAHPATSAFADPDDFERWDLVDPGKKTLATYYVSSHGRVKSVRRYKGGRRGKVARTEEKMLSQCVVKDKSGRVDRCHVCLGARNVKYVHHLVAHAFIGPRPDGLVIDHRDGDPTNNDVRNLRYVTQAENVMNTVRGDDYGIHKYTVKGKYTYYAVQFRRDGVLTHYSNHKSKAEAVAARDAKLAELDAAAREGAEHCR